MGHRGDVSSLAPARRRQATSSLIEENFAARHVLTFTQTSKFYSIPHKDRTPVRGIGEEREKCRSTRPP